jgi:photosystem II stability/assembly factor-like uncharacterized protein
MTFRTCGSPRLQRPLLAGLAFLAMAGWGGAVGAPAWQLPDVLDVPATVWPAAARLAVTGISASGRRVVAVGPRGFILRSEDGAATWKQVPCPVSADLTSVKFVSPDRVWAVGHDAVVLKSADGGTTWARVLDGRAVYQLMRKAAETDPALKKDVDRTMEQSATAGVWPTALMDIAFLDAQRGFVVGAFGLILATTDGGKTWLPWMARTDNERQFHLYGITTGVPRPYIAGEQGLLLRLDEAGARFTHVETPYNGSYFGVAVEGDRVVAHGLRGNVFFSSDAGSHWQRIATGTEANIVSASLQADRMLLTTQSGDLLSSTATGPAARVVSSPGAEVYGAVTVAPDRQALARLSGVGTVEIPRAP